MISPEDAASRLMRCWNATDSECWRDTLVELVAQDLHYVDPHFPSPIVGCAAYLDFVTEVRRQFPEIRFQLLCASLHHGLGLIDWSLRLSNIADISFGSFFYELDSNNQIKRLVGFGRAPSPDRPAPAQRN